MRFTTSLCPSGSGMDNAWHPCGTRDTLPKRVPALYTKAMWHPCTLELKKTCVTVVCGADSVFHVWKNCFVLIK